MRTELRFAHCWFDTDRVPHDPATTAWKRTARLRQARWREAHGDPIGTEPYAGGDGATLVGSRLDFDFAKGSGANFLSSNIIAAVNARLAASEPGQTLKEDRLWADLLSSMPPCFNLCGELHADSDLADKAVRAWWPDSPQRRVAVRFEHSPDRSAPLFLGNKSALDVAFEISDGTLGIIGVETKYHEHAKAEAIPKPKALARYEQVTKLSGIFTPDWRTAIVGTDLQQIWLDHLLVLSMLQHPSKRWSWGRFVLVSLSRTQASWRLLLGINKC
jgi:PD-(D/E)XK nuclease superfamily